MTGRGNRAVFSGLAASALTTAALSAIMVLGSALGAPGYFALLVTVGSILMLVAGLMTAVLLFVAGGAPSKALAIVAIVVFGVMAWAGVAQSTSAQAALGSAALLFVYLGIPAVALAVAVVCTALAVAYRGLRSTPSTIEP